MSKKKAKKPAKKAAKKAPKKAVKKAAQKASASRSGAVAVTVSAKRTAAATIFIYKVDGGYRVRTSPQLLSAPLGYIEWTVVNLASDDPVDVKITWPEGGPWGDAPIQIRNGNERKGTVDAKPGRYKYNVTANGYTEDPEVEYPEN